MASLNIRLVKHIYCPIVQNRQLIYNINCNEFTVIVCGRNHVFFKTQTLPGKFLLFMVFDKFVTHFYPPCPNFSYCQSPHDVLQCSTNCIPRYLRYICCIDLYFLLRLNYGFQHFQHPDHVFFFMFVDLQVSMSLRPW